MITIRYEVKRTKVTISLRVNVVKGLVKQVKYCRRGEVQYSWNCGVPEMNSQCMRIESFKQNRKNEWLNEDKGIRIMIK